MVLTLCTGLRQDSRLKMAISGTKVPLFIQLLAGCLDCLNWLVWSKSKKAQKNLDRPSSILKELMNPVKKEAQGFTTPEEFEKARQKIIGKE